MIEILASGALSSIQDEGRHGFRRFGVGTAGAMDALAYRAANLLVGNTVAAPHSHGAAIGAAAIEVTVYPFVARFLADCRVALTGALTGIRLDEHSRLPWSTFDAAAGQTLRLDAPRAGVRTYLAIRGDEVMDARDTDAAADAADNVPDGGLAVPLVLGSRSTDIKGGFGGFKGRCLKRGDVVPFAPVKSRIARRAFAVRPPETSLGAAPTDVAPLTIRVVEGPEYGYFDAVSQASFWREAWTITADSNRIGLRLDGTPMVLREPLEMRSHGIVPGVVQVPPQGKPIVLMRDCQTSGGYPKIATVIPADLRKLAQASLGSRFTFESVSVAEAGRATQRHDDYLAAIDNALWRQTWK
ncbi:biotin-dependent carboxyltransferase family protein [Robbsia sp. KACC 23696]|uniref:5-oxoprolinase subunit C family protein n=1 Tax=Robbsia sp. KACC 23696 TaxID=3149231 RepID=UPI00325A57A8